jgi:gliding motility-associated-like protein
VTVTGANGCSSSSTQSVTQNTTLPAAAITIPAATALTCTTTSISLTATGGGTYSWSNGTAVLGTNATLNVTTPGTYTVTVTSSNGCTATAAQVITQSITVPTAAITAPSTTVVNCTTPTISLTATGGGTYSWSNGTAVVGTNATLNVTTSGTYTVTVTATNGCTATATQTITQNNTAPSVTITPPVSSVLTCTTTSISLTANGTGSVSWANPALISVNPTISVTTPGVYTVTLTATNGCTGTATQTITQNITAPPAAITTPTTTVLTCTTTTITLTATGGGTYSWSNGTTVVGTNATLSVTTPGTYTVTVTGTNGCTATAAQTITQNTTPPTAGINTPSTTILTCTTTSIPLTATGGGTYSWSNGTTVVGTTPTLTVTSPATYTVTVTAANGCTATASQVITQDIVTPTAAITNNTNATVLDCNTTQISLTGVGGTSASWSNGTSVVSSVANLSVTTAGTYTYTGTNANGCFDTESITITFTPNTNPTFTQIAAICTNGLFTLPTTSTNNVAGTWSPAPNYTTTTTYTFQPNTGICANTASMTIIVNPYPVISTQNDTICVGQSTTITSNVNLAGGTYSWTPTNAATSSISVSPIATTNYQVIYSLLGCSDTSTTEIFVKPVSTPVTSNQTICNGQAAELIATAPLAGGSFVWSTTQINDTIQVSPSSTTTYTVVYNLNGCISPIVNSIVTVNPVPTLGVNNSTICAGDNTTITAIPNLLGGTFYWGTPGIVGAASQTVSPLNDSTITVYYTLNGCTSPVATSSITVNPLPIATFSANITQGCNPLAVTLTADDVSNTSYTWSTSNALTGTGSQTNLQFQMNGGFDVTLTTTLNGCTVTESIANYIQVDNYPIAAFEPSSTMFTEPNQTLNFMNNSLGASNYAWNFGDGGTSTEEGPNHTFVGNELGVTVVLTAISNLGCTDTSQYFIGYDPGLVYYIPNSFTPDGDMNNQVFTPIFTSGIDNYNYTFYVFNRWGEIIFESNDPSIGWDGSYGVEGKDAEVGVYTYQIFIKIPNFDERKMILGHVNLIR